MNPEPTTTVRHLVAIVLPDQGGHALDSFGDFIRIEIPGLTGEKRRHAYHGRLYDVSNAADRAAHNEAWNQLFETNAYRWPTMPISLAVEEVKVITPKIEAPPAVEEPVQPVETPSSEDLKAQEVDLSEPAPVMLPMPEAPSVPQVEEEPTPAEVHKTVTQFHQSDATAAEAPPASIDNLPEPEAEAPKPKAHASKKAAKKAAKK